MRLAIIGGGGFGREVLDLVDALNVARTSDNFEIAGVLDDGQPDLDLLKPWGAEHIGPIARLHHLPADVGYVIGIGQPQVREKIDREFREERDSPVLVHPSVTMGREVQLGRGTIVCAGARLTNHITLGRHVHVNLNCTIGHDSTLGDYATLSPLTAISGNVRVNDRAFFGTGASINPGITIGADAVVGSGAAAVKDAPAGVTSVGVPARPR